MSRTPLAAAVRALMTASPLPYRAKAVKVSRADLAAVYDALRLADEAQAVEDRQVAHRALGQGEVWECDRTGWDSGAWDDEPDLEKFEHAGLACEVRRSRRSGHLCGYVTLPEEHALRGAPSGDFRGAEVHGCVTYSAAGIDQRMWIVGFDCGHLHDRHPRPDPDLFDCSATYCDFAYVRANVCHLAEFCRAADMAAGLPDAKEPA